MEYRQPRRSRKLLHTLLCFDRLDHRVQVERVFLPLANLPTAFDGARIAVVSDLHLPDMAVPPAMLFAALRRERPDVIFLTGDLTNSYTAFDTEGLRRMAQVLTAIAPCYAVPGNHEWRLEREPLYRRILTEAGVTYLCDSTATWQRDGQCLPIYGLGRLRPRPLGEHPTLVLSHKPDYFPYYCQVRWDAVFCGHAHGGQVRWGRWALYAPGQGFFPRYTGGVYAARSTRMVVSRGLGNSSIPWRLGNHPHLPIVTLKGI